MLQFHCQFTKISTHFFLCLKCLHVHFLSLYLFTVHHLKLENPLLKPLVKFHNRLRVIFTTWWNGNFFGWWWRSVSFSIIKCREFFLVIILWSFFSHEKYYNFITILKSILVWKCGQNGKHFYGERTSWVARFSKSLKLLLQWPVFFLPHSSESLHAIL